MIFFQSSNGAIQKTVIIYSTSATNIDSLK